MKQTKKEILAGCIKEVKSAKIIANNTLKIEYVDNTIAIRLHDTDVLTFVKNKIIVNSGGWNTLTTRNRINTFSLLRMSTEKGLPYINGHSFYDGITFNKEGKLLSKKKSHNTKKINKLKAQIKGYCNLITKDNLPLPSNGDCWFCLMTTNGETLGDVTSNTDHLLQHIKEGYLHGSILVNSMKFAGYNNEQINYHYQIKAIDTFKRNLRKYLIKKLIK